MSPSAAVSGPLPSRRELFSLPLLLLGCTPEAVAVYLVRHAEKATSPLGAPPDKDPPLSAAGVARAEGLRAALDAVDLSAIFASEFKRTQQTVAPCAEARGLMVEVVKADDTKTLVVKIRQHLGRAVLVAAHSNTVPEIAALLGTPQDLSLGEDDYGDLFTITARGKEARVERARFEPI